MEKIKPFSMSYNEATKKGEIKIYGDITNYEYFKDDVMAWSFAKELDTMKDAEEITFRFKSNGGDVSEGIAIYNLIRDLKCKTIAKVDGIVASIATVILMACDKIIMSDVSLLMIHKPSTYVGYANEDALEERKKVLQKVLEPAMAAYKSRFKLGEEKLNAMLNAGDTWLTASECLEMGFCTEISTYSEFTQSLEEQNTKQLIFKNRAQAQEIANLKQKIIDLEQTQNPKSQEPQEPTPVPEPKATSNEILTQYFFGG